LLQIGGKNFVARKLREPIRQWRGAGVDVSFDRRESLAVIFSHEKFVFIMFQNEIFGSKKAGGIRRAGRPPTAACPIL
jgi:hypothetical protein